MAHALPYRDLSTRLLKLDARATGYQIDIDKDICWDRIDEPGHYVGEGFLADLGVDVAALRAHDEAFALYQWAFALLTTENFQMTEQDVIDHLARYPTLMGHRSNRLLVDEERKHIEMFKRFGNALRSQHPAWTFSFDTLFAQLDCGPFGMETLAGLDDPSLEHLAFWAAMVYFEEVTIYFHARLRRDPDIQPCWASLHEAHMREEVQHLLTDDAHLGALTRPGDTATVAAEMLQQVMRTGFHRAFPLRVAEAMVREEFPDLDLAPPRPPEETRVWRDIVDGHPVFRRTRSLLAPTSEQDAPAGTGVPKSAAEVEAWLVRRIASALDLEPGEVDPRGDLQGLALDSLKATEIASDLEQWLGRPLPATVLWDHPTLRSISKQLTKQES